MRWLIKAMKNEDSRESADEFGSLSFDGDIRATAREAARLAERHGWIILAYLDEGGEKGLEDWIFSCRRLPSGAFIWEGDEDIVRHCGNRHQWVDTDNTFLISERGDEK